MLRSKRRETRKRSNKTKLGMRMRRRKVNEKRK
jgi:hypothetical protein